MCDKEEKIPIEPARGVRLIIFNLKEVLQRISRDKTPPNLPGSSAKD